MKKTTMLLAVMFLSSTSLLYLTKTAHCLTVSAREEMHQVTGANLINNSWPDKWFMNDGIIIDRDIATLTGGFVLFDLAAIHAPISSGIFSLIIDNASGTLWQHYPAIQRTVTIFDITTDIDTILPPDNLLSVSEDDFWQYYIDTRQDLTSGVVYGDFNVTYGDRGVLINVILNDDAITDINNAARGHDTRFAVGLGALGEFEGTGEFAWPEGHFAHLSQAQLILTPVPEPATMLLFGAGLVGLSGVVSRKKKS